MKVVTAEIIREMDRRAIAEFGIPGIVLMENAGRAVVEVIRRECGDLRGRRVVVFCGMGNNGGDGFVIARLLHLLGAAPFVWRVGNLESLKDDARTHFHIARSLSIPCIGFSGEYSPANSEDIIVDALLGTGVKAAPRDAYAEAIQAINESGAAVFAVDIPSGVDADTGATPGAAVRATHTITFAYPKLGLYLFPGAECVGKLHIADIGFDWKLLEADTPYQVIQPVPVKKRRADSNKGEYGHVGILAGSRGMAGAPALVARAAQRVGAGLVTVLAAACVQPTIGAKLDEQMTIPLPDMDGVVSGAAFDAIAKFAEKGTVLCIGPGLTTAEETVTLVQRLLVEIKRPIVLDADGLNALAQKPDFVRGRPDDPNAPLILTPHPGEAARLLGTSIEAVESDRIQAVRELASRYQAVALLKGRHTLLSDPSGRVYINTSGNPGMATGGSGDSLTGILGGLLAQAFAGHRHGSPEATPPNTLAVVAQGVHLHGLAGDLAAEQVGETGLVAGDIIAHLPAAIRLLEEES